MRGNWPLEYTEEVFFDLPPDQPTELFWEAKNSWECKNHLPKNQYLRLSFVFSFCSNCRHQQYCPDGPHDEVNDAWLFVGRQYDYADADMDELESDAFD